MDSINELEQTTAGSRNHEQAPDAAANELSNNKNRVVSSSSSSLVSVLNTTTYQINCTNCFNFRRRSRAISKNKQHARKVLVGKKSLKTVDLLPAAAPPASYSTAAQFSIKFHRFAFRSPVNNKLSRTPIMLNQRCCLSVSVVPSDRNNRAHKKRNVKFFNFFFNFYKNS